MWLWADEQTGGRGRMGRNWVSRPGNLYATYLFSTSATPAMASQLSFVAALAVHDMARALCPELTALIKWPNDVLIEGAKFCGILAEVVAAAPTRIALGCGVNVAHSPQGTPYPVTQLGSHLTVESVLQELDSSLSNRLEIWDEGRGFAAVREAWISRALGIGGQICVRNGQARIEGLFAGLAADGGLVVCQSDGREVILHSGDVTFAELERLRSRTV